MQEQFQKISVFGSVRCIACTLALPVLIAGCGSDELPAAATPQPQAAASATADAASDLTRKSVAAAGSAVEAARKSVS